MNSIRFAADRPSERVASLLATAWLVTAASLAVAAVPDVATSPPSPPSPTSPSPAEVAADDRGFVNSLGMTLRHVPAGRFRMGSAPGEPGHRTNEGPAHEVVIPRDFLMASTETTVGQFARFVAETGHVTEAERDAAGGFGLDWDTGRVVQARDIDFRDPGFPGFTPGDEHPAILLSWSDAEAFCRWLSEREGRRYRLPTEAEWEYAARGGTTGTWWHGEDPHGKANVADAALAAAIPAIPRTEAWDDGYAFLAPVGRYPANPLGLHDMHGNVWEWCADRHDDTAYARRATGEPHVDRVAPVAAATPGEDPGFRVIRGGGWLNPADQSRAAQRVYFTPTFRYCLLSGFRVVCEVDAADDVGTGR